MNTLITTLKRLPLTSALTTAAIFLFVPLFAQYGPMGVGNAEGINNQQRVVLWLDAEKIVANNGDPITMWEDLSGNGHHFTADPSFAPTYRTTGGPGGLPFVDFDKPLNRMICENFDMASESFTIYFVVKSNDSNYGLFSYAVGGSPNEVLIYNSNGYRMRMGSEDRSSAVGNINSASDWRYGGILWDNEDNDIWEYNHSVQDQRSSSTFGLGKVIPSGGTAAIGNVQTSLGGFASADSALVGGISEIFILEGTINKGNTRTIRSYIKNKYDIGPGGGWHKLNSPSTHKVTPISIGRDATTPAPNNSLEHRESRSDGLVLRALEGNLQGTRAYLLAANDGLANSVVSSNLPSEVPERWFRTWFIRKSDFGNGNQAQVAFSFGEGGIAGSEFPQLADGYELLYRSSNSGTFSVRNVSEKFVQDDEIVFRVTAGQLAGDGYYTLGTTDPIQSSLTGAATRTWYAYQTGNWDNPTTWTLDGSAAPAFVNSDSEIPAAGDAVVIGSGRTVTCNLNDRFQTSLKVFGTVDFNGTSGHNMGAISGNGTIRCSGAGGNGNFPAGDASAFANPNTGGQTVFYGSGFTQNSNLELNRVRITLNSSTDAIVLASNLTHNGLFEINKGTFQVNNAFSTARSIESFGDVLVESEGRIGLSLPNATHIWSFHKSFINEGGEVRFTNRMGPAYNATDFNRIVARFVNPEENQRLVANGISNFSQIVVNKGNDDTYILTVSANGENQFGLFGRANYGMGDNAYYNEGNNQSNALALVNGTIEIRENVFIPLHYGSGNYNINETATLWVNGGSAAKGPVLLPGAATNQAIVPYGTIRVSSGLLRADCTSGITTRANGLIQVDGGEVYANQIRTSVFGPTNIGGLIINGGLVDLDSSRPGGGAGQYYTLSLTYPGNLFRMTGGELRVSGPTSRGAVFINSDPEQTNVSGGTLIVDVSNTSNNYNVSSRVPFWNLEVRRTDNSTTNPNRPVRITGGTSDDQVIEDLPLIVRNNLIIRGANQATLRMRSNSNNPIDAHIQGNLTIENGGIYQHETNTTFFDGGSNSLLFLPFSGPTQNFFNVVVDKNSDERFARIQTGNGSLAMIAEGEFRLERGIFDNNNRNLRILGNVVNRSVFGTELSTGIIILQGSTQQELISDNGVFHNLWLLNNSGGVRLINGGITVRRNLRLQNCRFFIGSHKVRVEGENGSITYQNGGTSSFFVTDGNPGAGGIETVYNNASANELLHAAVEIGVGGLKYTPVRTVVNGNFSDPGFIRIVPVDESLSTANMDMASNYLDFHWKVFYSEFDTLPNVSHQFFYQNTDVNGSASNFASGRVLFDDPFSREIDSLNVFDDHVNLSNRSIFFNGPDVAQDNAGQGAKITNAAYTAGNIEMFQGRPQVFYSRTDALDADFNDPANWNELGQFSSGDDVFDYHGTGVSGNTDFPETGDIAFIGFNPVNGRPHSYRASTAGVTAAEVRFTPLQNAAGERLPRYDGPNPADITVLRPTFSFSNTAEIENIDQIIGEGTILLRGDADLTTVNLGDFLREDSSIVMVESDATTLNLNHLPAEVPNFFFTTSGNGSLVRGLRVQSNLNVRGDYEIVGNAKLNLNTGASGNITVGRDLKLAGYQAGTSAPEIRYPATGAVRSIEVLGDLRIEGDGARVQVQNPSAFPQLVHNLTVHKNIYQNTPVGTGLNLFTDPSNDFVALILKGTGNHTFVNDNGFAPNLGRILIDKGNDLSSGFSFNSLINVDAPANGETKPIELRNGLLTINDAATDITISSGGKNFVVPTSAGLALEAGTLRISGNEIGMNLSGLLRVDGGLFEIGNTEGQNNYIEYSSGGNAKIQVNGGQLLVGSQIRRGLTNTQGILDYRQTGGDVQVGVYGAPNANRGVLEVVNDGSRFDHTGGSLTLVRGVNSATSPSLLLNPTTHNISGTADLIVGNAVSPAGAQINNIGIQSEIALPSLRINNDSGNNPVVKIYTSSLTIEDQMEIAAGATFETGIYNLTLRGDIDNDGTLLSTSGKLILDHNILSDVTGSGVFDLNDLERIGGGVTVVNTDLLIKGDFSMDNGTADFGGNELRVQGGAQVDGNLNFATGQGMIMEGSGGQILRRSAAGTSLIDILTIDNPSGVNMIASAGHEFTIGEELRMKRGIFNLNGNLLDLGVNVSIEQVNAFGQNNMISTGGAFTNFGVRKAVAANTVEDLFMPLGLDKYMPIRLNFSDDDFSSGNTQSTYLFKLVQPSQNAVLDPNNVLQMYFSVQAESIGTGLRMDMELAYDDDYVAVTAPNTEEEYIGARIVDNSPTADVFKFVSDAVDPVENLILFSFDGVNEEGINGDYLAGIDEAIPDFVPVYTTTRDGEVNEGADSLGVYDQPVPGGGAPNGGIVNVVDSNVLVLNINGVTLYKTIINENATLVVDSTTFHRLGIVEGTGTIRLVDIGTLPSGIYNDFLTCTGGRLEYDGTTDYEILASLPTVRSIAVIGSGTRTMANNDVNVCEDFFVDGANFKFGSKNKLLIERDLLIDAGTFNTDQGDLEVEGNLNLTAGMFTAGNEGQRIIRGNITQSGGTSSIGSGGTTELLGNYTKTAGSYNGGAGSSCFVMKGTEEQFISGDFSGSNAFRMLELNNPEGVRLHNSVELNNAIMFANGHLHTAEDSLLHLTSESVSVQPTGGAPTSFVNGPMQWTLGTGPDRFFPVGKGNRNRPLRLSNRSNGRTWTVEYYDTLAVVNPAIWTLTPNDLAIETMSRREYWRVNSNTGDPTTARVGLSWGENSSVADDPGDYDKLLVMKYIPADSLWGSLGGENFNFNAVNNLGSFVSMNNASFSESFFTLGSGDAINPLPVTWLHFDGETDGKQHTLHWATASEINNNYFELERSLDGRFFTAIARIDGAGNSTTRLDYSYVDKMAPTGRVYYRLRQVDYNGEYDYADEIVTLLREESEKERLDFLLYPNPTSDGTVRMMISDFNAEMVIISFSDLSGQVLLRKAVWIDEQGISDFIPSNFTPGAYIVSVVHEGSMRSKPLIVTK